MTTYNNNSSGDQEVEMREQENSQQPLMFGWKQSSKGRLILVAMIAVAVGLIFLGMSLTIAGYVSADGNQALQIGGPTVLAIGVLLLLGVFVQCCMRSEQYRNSLDNISEGDPSPNVHVEYEKPKVAMKPVKSYSANPYGGGRAGAPVQAVEPSQSRVQQQRMYRAGGHRPPNQQHRQPPQQPQDMGYGGGNVRHDSYDRKEHFPHSHMESKPVADETGLHSVGLQKYPNQSKDLSPTQVVKMQYTQQKERDALLSNPNSGTMQSQASTTKPLTWGTSAMMVKSEVPTTESSYKPRPADRVQAHVAMQNRDNKENLSKDIAKKDSRGVTNKSFEESPTHRQDREHDRGRKDWEGDRSRQKEHLPPRNDQGYHHRSRSKGREDKYGNSKDQNRPRDHSKTRDHSSSRYRGDYSRDRERARSRSRGRYEDTRSRDNSRSRMYGGKKQASSFEDFTSMDFVSGLPLDLSLSGRRDESSSTIRNASEDDILYRDGHRRSKSSGRYRERNRSRSREGRPKYADDYDLDRAHRRNHHRRDSYSDDIPRGRVRERRDDHNKPRKSSRSRAERRGSDETDTTQIVPYSPTNATSNNKSKLSKDTNLNVISPAMTININAQAGSAVHLALGTHQRSQNQLPTLRLEPLAASSMSEDDIKT